MAVSDIPTLVTAQPGDLVSAGNWNLLQQLIRNTIRLHHHTRAVGTAPVDAGTSDDSTQITTAEMADASVTASKLAAGAVSTASIPDGAITNAKLAAGAVGTANIAGAAVTSAKLSFATVATTSLTLGPGGVSDQLVQSAAPSTKTTIYFPVLTITATSGTGVSEIGAQIVYRQAVGSTSIDVYIRLSNFGGATATLIWQVLTFSG